MPDESFLMTNLVIRAHGKESSSFPRNPEKQWAGWWRGNKVRWPALVRSLIGVFLKLTPSSRFQYPVIFCPASAGAPRTNGLTPLANGWCRWIIGDERRNREATLIKFAQLFGVIRRSLQPRRRWHMTTTYQKCLLVFRNCFLTAFPYGLWGRQHMEAKLSFHGFRSFVVIQYPSYSFKLSL
jgi:hypothetical protein